jgi:hypothetical protein
MQSYGKGKLPRNKEEKIEQTIIVWGAGTRNTKD